MNPEQTHPNYCPHYNGTCPHPRIPGGCWACEWYDYGREARGEPSPKLARMLRRLP